MFETGENGKAGENYGENGKKRILSKMEENHGTLERSLGIPAQVNIL